jgi:hypothetical protein
MYNENDPWSWVNEQKPVAPLSANIQALQEQTPPPMQQPNDPLMQMASLGAVNATAKGLEAGYKGYQLGKAVASAAPLGVTPEAAAATYNLGTGTLTGAGSQAAMLAAQDAALTGAGATVGSITAPLTAAGTTAAAGGAGATAAKAGAALGGETALAAMGPVGWAIGAGLLAKKLGIF